MSVDRNILTFVWYAIPLADTTPQPHTPSTVRRERLYLANRAGLFHFNKLHFSISPNLGSTFLGAPYYRTHVYLYVRPQGQQHPRITWSNEQTGLPNGQVHNLFQPEEYLLEHIHHHWAITTSDPLNSSFIPTAVNLTFDTSPSINLKNGDEIFIAFWHQPEESGNPLPLRTYVIADFDWIR